jgi:hypothetical protein
VVNDPLARAGAILDWAERPDVGRHRATRDRPATRPQPSLLRRWWSVAAVAAAGVVVAVPWLAAPTSDLAPAAVATLDPTAAEDRLLFELDTAGLNLTPAEQAAAVDIARKHVAHGHLIGMRAEILEDFAARIPRLSDEQDDVARVAVEHHFRAVTGKQQ